MRQRQKPGLTQANEQAERDQEVLRATRELAAYFRGRRTEREARAALKIIKAFVRGREELDPKSRPPLPGLAGRQVSRKLAPRYAAKRRPRRRTPEDTTQASEPVVPASSE